MESHPRAAGSALANAQPATVAPGAIHSGSSGPDPMMAYLTQMSANMNELTARIDQFTAHGAPPTASAEHGTAENTTGDERARGGHRGAFATRGRRARIPREGRGPPLDIDLTIAKRRIAQLSVPQRLARADILVSGPT